MTWTHWGERCPGRRWEIQQAGQAQQAQEYDQQLPVEDNFDLLQPLASVALPLADLNAQLGDPLNYGEVTVQTQRSLSAMVDTEPAKVLLHCMVMMRESRQG